MVALLVAIAPKRRPKSVAKALTASATEIANTNNL